MKNITISLLIFIIILLISLIVLQLNYKKLNENFAGSSQSQKKLNNTLIKISNDLNEYKIEDWFIGYGTLLGIIRDSNCIDGDDDVDIIISKDESYKLHNLIKDKGYKYDIMNNKTMKFKNFTRILLSDDLTPIDFYIATKEKNNFNETWEKVIWTNVFPVKKKKWKNKSILNIPNNYEIKLEGRYGKTWKEPKKWKGPKPAKKVI
jgi:hypothetical protein